ncbi:MAG TPA: hypothetical protein VNT75_20900 [Symbiobacteriaceae bacterium]|nr:hypothetical protein [Symbiobacteriaceae bacterium]
MSEKNSGPFVNLIRKAVGLPTGNSSCCGTPAADNSAPAKEGCCGPAPVKEQKSGGCC